MVLRKVGPTDAVIYGVTHFLGNLYNYFTPIAMGECELLNKTHPNWVLVFPLLALWVIRIGLPV